MTVIEIIQAAKTLSNAERASLVEYLLDGLAQPHHDVSDEEVLDRKRELDSGEVADVSLDELKEGLVFLRGS